MNKKTLLLTILFFTLLALDFTTKNLASQFLWETKYIFWDFFYLQLLKNPWIAFSIWVPSFALKSITIVLIFLIVYYYKKQEASKNKWYIDIAFILIIAGALWNAYERIFIWEVIDFIGIKYFSVFNFADMYISLWVIIYIVNTIIWHKKIPFDQDK